MRTSGGAGLRSGRWRPVWLLTAVVAAVLAATGVRAVELVPGDYGRLPAPGSTPLAATAPEEPAFSPFVILFTPRSAGLLGLEEAARTGPAGRLDFGIDGLGLLGIGRLGLQGAEVARQGDHMLVGGGFAYNGFAFGGAYGRSLLLGREADLIAAGIGYGAFSASFGYAWREEAGEDPLGMLMFNSDLVALPWLAFESDVAVGESGDDQPIAVGRIGIRLNF